MSFTDESNTYPLNASDYRRLPAYSRTQRATGIDLQVKALDDLTTTAFGDLQTLDGAELIQAALLRRLKTPAGGYRRWVQTSDGLVELDTDYGDTLYNYLSAPLTATTSLQIEQAVKAAASADSRIEVLSVKADVSGSNSASLTVTLRYRLLGESTLQTLQYNLTSTLQTLSA